MVNVPTWKCDHAGPARRPGHRGHTISIYANRSLGAPHDINRPGEAALGHAIGKGQARPTSSVTTDGPSAFLRLAANTPGAHSVGVLDSDGKLTGP